MTFPASRFVFLALFALAVAGCGKKADPADAAAANESASMAVTLARAERKPIQRSLIASGPVTAWEEMQLGVELSGLRVTALHVDVGQAVRKGQVLLEIDHQTLDSDLRQAQAAASEASE